MFPCSGSIQNISFTHGFPFSSLVFYILSEQLNSHTIGVVFVCVHIACPLLLNRYIHGFLFLDIHESNRFIAAISGFSGFIFVIAQEQMIGMINILQTIYIPFILPY